MNIRKLLYESFDRKLSEKEAEKLKTALSKSNKLNKEKSELSYMREMVFRNAQKDFSPGFELEVMRKLNLAGTKETYPVMFFNTLSKSFRPLAFASIIFILITLTYNVTKSGRISFQSAFGITQNNTTLADDVKSLFSFYQ